MMPDWLPVVLWLLPLGTAALVGCLPQRAAGTAHLLAAAAMAIATGLAGWLAATVLGSGTAVQGPHATWLDLGTFTLGIGVYVDAMGAVMALLVCLLGTLVLLYNRWYMHDDPQSGRFPWQFCGFLFAMLGVFVTSYLVD